MTEKTLPATLAVDAPAVLVASATVVQLRPGIAATDFDIKPVGAAGKSPQRVVAIESGRGGHVTSMHGSLPAEPIVRVTTAGEKR
jgi:hypothetical protein